MESSKQSRSYCIIQYLKDVMSAYIIRGIYFANYHYPLSTSWATGSRRDLCNVQVAQYVKDVQYLELQKTTLLSCYCHHDD